MNYKNAIKLSNGDEVILKSTGESAFVKQTRHIEFTKSVMIDVVVGNEWFPNIHHTHLK